MKRVRRTRTAPEEAVAELLRWIGLRMRRNVSSLPGSPDFANKSRRIAIFVHGCFWHAHPGCDRARMPKANRTFWRTKLSANVARDERKRRALKAAGYRVTVIWECEVGTSMVRRRLRRLEALAVRPAP
jgi:DNA mismatch endonuclease (patch repair protein)